VQWFCRGCVEKVAASQCPAGTTLDIEPKEFGHYGPWAQYFFGLYGNVKSAGSDPLRHLNRYGHVRHSDAGRAGIGETCPQTCKKITKHPEEKRKTRGPFNQQEERIRPVRRRL
jgi:hypothetical protein